MVRWRPKKLWFKTKTSETFVRPQRKLWFRNKRWGYGWTPASFEGWAVIAVYVLIVVGWFMAVDSRSHSGSDTLLNMVIPFIILTSLLIVICYLTGEDLKFGQGDN